MKKVVSIMIVAIILIVFQMNAFASETSVEADAETSSVVNNTNHSEEEGDYIDSVNEQVDNGEGVVIDSGMNAIDEQTMNELANDEDVVYVDDFQIISEEIIPADPGLTRFGGEAADPTYRLTVYSETLDDTIIFELSSEPSATKQQDGYYYRDITTVGYVQNSTGNRWGKIHVDHRMNITNNAFMWHSGLRYYLKETSHPNRPHIFGVHDMRPFYLDQVWVGPTTAYKTMKLRNYFSYRSDNLKIQYIFGLTFNIRIANGGWYVVSKYSEYPSKIVS